jgi:hypothetical protein
VGKGWCCQGHGYVHETTWCQDVEANSYCFETLSWFYYKFHVFKRNTFKKRNFHYKSPLLPTIWKGAWKSILAYFEYHQIWLNIFMDDCHNITKLKIKWNMGSKKDSFLTINYE